jgi:hypothetical protein
VRAEFIYGFGFATSGAFSSFHGLR